MKATSSRTLNPLNIKWLVLLAVLDMIIVLFFVAPELTDRITLTKLAVMRALGITVLPVGVLLLTGLLSANVKAMLVFWKMANPLPGSEAFTKYCGTDTRIDLAALKKNVGTLPTDAAEQNAKWYKLYRMVADDVAVVESHKRFLMYRDMAAMSLPLIVLVPLGLRIAGAGGLAEWIAVCVFLLQYLASALGARHNGVRFVCTVLAIHSTRKVTAPKARPAG
jgi:hypothetical protein